MSKYKNKTIKLAFLLILSVPLFCQSSIAGSGYSISKYTLSNGGGMSTGGNFKVNGSIAQVLTENSHASEHSIKSGFWQQLTNTDIIFKHGFEQ